MATTRASDLRPALAASAALHGAILLALLVSWRLAPKTIPMHATAVTLVTSGPEPNERPAVEAPERQAAAAPNPEPQAPPAPPAPVEAPTPRPAPPPPPPEPRPHRQIPKPAPEPPPKPEPKPEPQPKPERAPTPKPAPPKPEPKPPPKPQPAPKPEPKPPPKPQPDLNLKALAESAPKHAAPTPLDLSALAAKPHARSAPADLDLSALAKASRSHATRPSTDTLDLSALAAGPRRGGGAKGAPRVETEKAARLAVGQATALTGDEIGALKAKIIPLWHPNCDVAGGSKVVVKIEMRLTADHHLAGPPKLAGVSAGGASEDVVSASAQRALAAVAHGAPYSELSNTAPRDFILSFNAKDACGG